jgi:hypothetical protein
MYIVDANTEYEAARLPHPLAILALRLCYAQYMIATRSRKFLLIIAFAASLAVLGSLVRAGVFGSAVPPIPEKFTKNPAVKLYHPKSLPGDLAFLPQDTYVEKDALITKFSKADGQGNLLLTQQPRPQDVDLEEVDTAEKYLSHPGSVYMLKGEKGKIQVIVTAGDTWLLVSADESITKQLVKDFIDSLQPLP